MNYFTKIHFAVFLMLSASSIQAKDYTYIDYARGATDPESTSNYGKYTSLSSSFEIQNNAFLTFESTQYEDTNRYDIDIKAIGMGGLTDYGLRTDLYGMVQLIRSNLGYSKNTGFRITLGLRSNLSNNVEFAAKAKYEDVYTEASNSYALSLRYYFTTALSAGASYETASINESDMNALYGSLRLNF